MKTISAKNISAKTQNVKKKIKNPKCDKNSKNQKKNTKLKM